jgi:plasmid stabilization system protein ParE
LVLEYWKNRNRSSDYSLKLLDAVEANLDGVAKNPERCPQSVFQETRVSSLGHYSIFYKVERKEIVVISFWDNRQDPKKLLGILKKNAK